MIQVQFRDNIWNPLTKAIVLDTRYGSVIDILPFSFLQYFQSFRYLLHANQKSSFMGENGIALSFTSHGTGLAPKIWKRLSSVRNEHPNGQVRSCHVKLSGSETTYTAFSVSHRIAAYQIPCQSGHRAQRRLVYQTLSIHKSLQGISSFSISAHGNWYLAKFEMSAILFGIHRDDVLPMTCTNHW